MRAGPSSTMVRTTFSLHNPAPAVSVSRTCESNESSFLDDGADDVFLAQPRARRECVAHVRIERILLARHRRDAALRVIRVRLRPVLFGDDGHTPAWRDLQREGQ